MISFNDIEKIESFYEKISRGERKLFSFFSYFEEKEFLVEEKKVLSRLLIESIIFKNRNRFLIHKFSELNNKKIYKSDVRYFFIINCFFRKVLDKSSSDDPERILLQRFLKKKKYKVFHAFLSEKTNSLLKKLKNESFYEFLKVFYSHPDWFIKSILNSYGVEVSKKILSFNNLQPFLFFVRDSYESKLISLEDFFSMDEGERKRFVGYFLISTFFDFLTKRLNFNRREKILIFDHGMSNVVPHVSMLMRGMGEIFLLSNMKKKYRGLIKSFDLQNVRLVDNIKDVGKISFDRFIFILDGTFSGEWRNKPYLKWTLTPQIVKKKHEENIENFEKIWKNIGNLGEILILSGSILFDENKKITKKIKSLTGWKFSPIDEFNHIGIGEDFGYIFLPSKFLNTSGGFVSKLVNS